MCVTLYSDGVVYVFYSMVWYVVRYRIVRARVYVNTWVIMRHFLIVTANVRAVVPDSASTSRVAPFQSLRDSASPDPDSAAVLPLPLQSCHVLLRRRRSPLGPSSRASSQCARLRGTPGAASSGF